MTDTPQTRLFARPPAPGLLTEDAERLALEVEARYHAIRHENGDHDNVVTRFMLDAWREGFFDCVLAVARACPVRPELLDRDADAR